MFVETECYRRLRREVEHGVINFRPSPHSIVTRMLTLRPHHSRGSPLGAGCRLGAAEHPALFSDATPFFGAHPTPARLGRLPGAAGPLGRGKTRGARLPAPAAQLHPPPGQNIFIFF